MGERRFFAGMLLMLGLGWGLTQPLGKMATVTGHPPFALIFWQLVVCVLVLGAITAVRGKGLVLRRDAMQFYLVVAVLGTLVPNATFYISVAKLPAGIMSILISTVPLMAFPMALLLRTDKFTWPRLLGLLLGLTGVALIALPEASLPDPAMAAFLPLAMIGPLFYAIEATYVSKAGMAGMDPVQAMFGASVLGLVLCLPIVLLTGQWVDPRFEWGGPELALVASSALHALLYSAYVWLALKAGSVFAAQSSYLVTASGVIWAMILLGERFSPWVWAAMIVMLAGISLVQPRKKAATV